MTALFKHPSGRLKVTRIELGTPDSADASLRARKFMRLIHWSAQKAIKPFNQLLYHLVAQITDQ
ncbi:MAG: hypothetical protein ABIJ59_09740 [Pseudomonadota bacterium]